MEKYDLIVFLDVFFPEFKPQEARNSSSSFKSADKAPVRIAYLLTVNGRASRQVRRLISILYDPLHLFYIHVDAVSLYNIFSYIFNRNYLIFLFFKNFD